MFISMIIVASAIMSCSNTEEEPIIPTVCEAIDYNQKFTISDNTYFCFPDGAELRVERLLNHFCPCDVICVSAGHMSIDVVWIDTLGFETKGQLAIESNSQQNNLNGALGKWNIERETDWFMRFEKECNDDNPRPKILEAEVILRE